MPRFLFAFDPDPSLTKDGAAPLEQALKTLLSHMAFSNILMQIGAEQRSYLIADGCDGCTYGRCQPGCRADSLQRTLHGAGAGSLRLVKGGLASRPYRYGWLLIPSQSAQPLTASMLAEAHDARLIQHWGQQSGKALLYRSQTLLFADQVITNWQNPHWRAISLHHRVVMPPPAL
jgi:hypothetical protein